MEYGIFSTYIADTGESSLQVDFWKYEWIRMI